MLQRLDVARLRSIGEDADADRFRIGPGSLDDGPGFDMWSDTTTLFITVHDGEGPDSPVLGKGILKIDPKDFSRQMTTMRPTNARNDQERLQALARFGQFFA